jgi:hypothetical protein
LQLPGSTAILFTDRVSGLEVACIQWGVPVTTKSPELDAVPPGVTIAILPVTALLGTVDVTCPSEFTVKLGAATPPKVTTVV